MYGATEVIEDMNRMHLVLLASALMLPAFDSVAQDAERGADAYELCASCHGFKGEGNQLVGAPRLAGLESWYLQRQLRNFRHGIRGTAAEDTKGRTMAQMTAGLDTDGEIADIVAHIGKLPARRASATVEGDVDRGRSAYAPCASCHGPKAEGNPSLNAPALAGLDDWYQFAQLEKFRRGIRGANPDDVYGQQMAPMATVLADEQTMRDVVAYINSLQ